MIKKANLLLIPILTLSFMASSCKKGRNIAVIGLSDKNKEYTKYLPVINNEYQIGDVVNSMQKQILSSLRSAQTETPSWRLEEIKIGLGLSTGLNFEFVKFGASSTYNFRFENFN